MASICIANRARGLAVGLVVAGGRAGGRSARYRGRPGTGQTGTLELRIDGQAQKFNNGSTVAHLGTWGGGLQDVHFGLYRRVTVMGTDAHYISHLRVATTAEAAKPPM